MTSARSRAASCGGAATAFPAPGISRAAAFSLGASLRWWRDKLGRNELDESSQRGTSPYSIMVEQATRSKPGANGAMFHSFMASQVTPYYDAVARGGFLGLGLITNAMT